MLISYHGEFTWDIATVAPFAYYLHLRGELEETHGPIGSYPIFFFSPKHIESGHRQGGNTAFVPLEVTGCVIGGDVYNRELHTDKWVMPPWKEHFKNNRFVYDKPLLIINNKYTEEWGKPPVNYIDVEVLMRIIDALKNKYQIVYIRPTYEEKGISYDYHILYNWFDYDILKKYFREDIIFFNDLLKENDDLRFNDLQFMLGANCENFISVQGGNAFVSSIFGGKNLVYANAPSEHTQCYWDGGYVGKRFGCNVVFSHGYQLKFLDKAMELFA